MKAALAALMAMLGLGLGACASEPGTASWARDLEVRRATAEAQTRAGETDAASATLRGILAMEAPEATDPRVTSLLADTHFALGSVLMSLGQPGEARVVATRGLALGEAGEVFTANLHALRAMALEAEGRPLDALTDYEAALAIYTARFEEALE